jgi:hypothetical protein
MLMDGSSETGLVEAELAILYTPLDLCLRLPTNGRSGCEQPAIWSLQPYTGGGHRRCSKAVWRG